MEQTNVYTNTIHYKFADFLCKKYNCTNPLYEAILFLTSYMSANGHTCLPIEHIAHKQLRNCVYEDIEGIPDITFPSQKDLESYIVRCNAIGVDGVVKPVIYENGSCYLYRYWYYENTVYQFIYSRCMSAHDEQKSNDLMPILMKKDELHFAAEQLEAIRKAISQPLCVISGGPGTGKTTVIAAIVYQLLTINQQCSIALCAPTGKAATRLSEAIAKFKDNLSDDELKNSFPTETSTIHRLLVYQHGKLDFRFNQDNPLPHDVVIVDECSMVDMSLMAKLCMALKKDARLILVGDKDQLASVEAGGFFGDICWGVSLECFSNDCTNKSQQRSAQLSHTNTLPNKLLNNIVVLKETFRFGKDSGIGILANAIRNNDEKLLIEVLNGTYNDVEYIEYDSMQSLYNYVTNEAYKHFADVITHSHIDIGEVYDRIKKMIILTPFNKGPWGSTTFNAIIEKMLNPGTRKEWYNGRIIMVTGNDYNLQVFNGDTGVYSEQEEMVWFSPNGDKKINYSLLAEYTPAYSITVHKSQGSEYEHVIFVLPHGKIEEHEFWQLLLTRELLYTAVTRAQKHLTIVGRKELIAYMLTNPTMRATGLRYKLWGKGNV